MNPKTKKIVSVLSLASVLLFIMVLVSQSVGLAGTGFDTAAILNQFYFYVAPGIGFLLGIIAVFAIEMFITKGDEKYGSSILFAEPGEDPSLPFFKKIGLLHMFVLSLIVFGVLGLLNFVGTQTIFTGVGVLAHQFTPATNILYSSTLIPASENAGLAFLLSFVIFGYRFVARKLKMSKGNFQIFLYLLVPLSAGLYGTTNHILRYGSSDLNLFVVFVFWAIGGLLTLVTGNFIPFWVLHIMNNLFYDLGLYFSNELVLIYTIATLIALIAIYLVFFFGATKRTGD
jgi:hypothetical protein